jgi:hypothetical protein
MISIVLASLLVLAAPVRAGAQAHPALLFDAAGLVELRTRVSNPAYADLVTALRGGMDARVGRTLLSGEFSGDVRMSGNAIGGFALAASILNRDSDWATARAALLGALSWGDWGFGEGDDLNRGHIILGVAIAYDLLHGRLTDAERASVRSRLASEAARHAAAYDANIWWRLDRLQNHNWINTAAIGLAGLALDGEDSRAPSWVTRARSNWSQVKPLMDRITDGSWHEGVAYQVYGWIHAMPFWLAADRRGFDVSDSVVLRSYGRYRLGAHLPEDARRYVTTHGDWTGWAGPGTSTVLRYAAARFKDGAAQELARRYAAAAPRSQAAWDVLAVGMEFLVHDPSVPALDMAREPLDFHGNDQQLAVLRSRWSAGGTVLGFKAGVLGGRGNFELLRDGQFPDTYNIGHDHIDDLGLWIYGDGEWLLPECVGYNIGRTSGPKAWMAEFHNTLLVNGTGQLGDDRSYGLDGKRIPWMLQRDADLSLLGSTAHYAFARGEGARLYPAAANVSRVVRTVALAREGHIVLHDDIRLSAAAPVDQVFHFLDAASQDGAWIRGNSKNDRVLGLRVVAPASFTATITAQTADKLSKQFEPDASVSLVKVRPATAGANNTFLEVLYPTRGASWSARPNVQPLDPARPQSGFSLPLAAARERWVYGSDGAATAAGLTLAGDAGLVRTGSTGAVERTVLVGRGRLADGARELVANPNNGIAEIELVGSTANVTGANLEGLTFWAPTTVTTITRDGASVAWSRDGERILLGVAPAPAPSPVPTSGALLFADNFDACATTLGLGPNWTVNGKIYCASGRARGEAAGATARAAMADAADVRVSARVLLTDTATASGVIARASSAGYYGLRLLSTGRLQLVRVNGTTSKVLADVARSFTAGTSQTLELTVTGSATVTLSAKLNGVLATTVTDSTTSRLGAGRGGLVSGSTVRTQFDDFTVRTP